MKWLCQCVRLASFQRAINITSASRLIEVFSDKVSVQQVFRWSNKVTSLKISYQPPEMRTLAFRTQSSEVSWAATIICFYGCNILWSKENLLEMKFVATLTSSPFLTVHGSAEQGSTLTDWILPGETAVTENEYKNGHFVKSCYSTYHMAWMSFLSKSAKMPTEKGKLKWWLQVSFL